MLDRKKALTFECSKCDRPSQRHRNCSGKNPPAINLVNFTIYERCPKAQWLEAGSERNLVALYIDCKESHALPDTGRLLDQTAFTVDLFSYCDSIVAEYRQRQQDKQSEDAAELRKQAEQRGK